MRGIWWQSRPGVPAVLVPTVRREVMGMVSSQGRFSSLHTRRARRHEVLHRLLADELDEGEGHGLRGMV